MTITAMLRVSCFRLEAEEAYAWGLGSSGSARFNPYESDLRSPFAVKRMVGAGQDGQAEFTLALAARTTTSLGRSVLLRST